MTRARLKINGKPYIVTSSGLEPVEGNRKQRRAQGRKRK
jgi:hypothetical protein